MDRPVLVQVINLDRERERLRQTVEALSDFGISYERLPAVSGDEVQNRRDPRSSRFLGRDLYPGEIGCYLSHLKAIDRFLRSDSEFALVLEDDAMPSVSGKARFAELADCLTRLPKWNVINLGRAAKRISTGVGFEFCDPGIGLCHAHYPPMTATALLWSRMGAMEFRRLFSRPVLPFDVAVQSWGARTDGVLALRRPIFAPRGVESTIKATDRHSGGPGAYSVFARLGRIGRNKWYAGRNRRLLRIG